MIARMKKVFLVLYEKDKTASLAELRKLGVLHVESLSGSGESYEGLLADKACLEKAIGILFYRKAEQSGEFFSIEEGRSFAARVNALSEESKKRRDRIAETMSEIERLRPWGDFDPVGLKDPAGGKIALTPYEIPAKRLASLDPSVEFLRISERKGLARIAVIGEPPSSKDLRRFELPSARLSLLEAELERLRAAGKAAEAEMERAAGRVASLQNAIALVGRELAFETIRSGMAGEGVVAWFSGWVPEKAAEKLKSRAGEKAWGLMLDDPAEDEQPPTKIENPPLLRLIQPVFEFLGTVPHYREYDISGWFLFFLCIFFAMIFGDGGYGALLLLGGLAVAAKFRKAGRPVPDIVRLILLMAGSTVIWGLLTASWFGLDPAVLPGFLKAPAIPWISNENPNSGENVKVICFLIGMVHLIIAHLKNIKRDLPSLKSLAQAGQLAMVGGMFFVVLSLVISARRFPIPGWAPILIAGGFALNFIFANYPSGRPFLASVGRSILGSFENIVSVILGIVGIFGDIVSYIRLWAVGMAGLAISQTLNGLAGPMLGRFVFFALGVMLLVFGHGLNLIMSGLGLIVHGIRLNMLEFSGHLGMEWSGYKYAPFRDPVGAFDGDTNSHHKEQGDWP